MFERQPLLSLEPCYWFCPPDHFDNTEENKLIYTELFTQFTEMTGGPQLAGSVHCLCK